MVTAQGGGRRTAYVYVALRMTTHGTYRNRPSGEEEEDGNHGDIFVGHYDLIYAGIGSTSSANVEFMYA